MVGLERFEFHRVVAIILVADLAEIVRADIHRQAAAPVVRHPRIGDRSSRHDALDLVDAAAEGDFERGGGDVARLAGGIRSGPPMFRQHVDLADDLRQLAVSGFVKREGDFAFPGDFGLHHVTIVERLIGIVLLEHPEGPDDVFRSDGLAVVPFRLAAQAISHRGPVGRVPNRLREQPVFACDLIERRRHERVVDERDPGRDRALGDREISVSKEPSRDSRTSPPWGAFGLTYSNCLKLAGYFRSPNSERPWRHAADVASGESSGCACARASSGSGAMPAAPSAGAATVRRADLMTDRRVGSTCIFTWRLRVQASDQAGYCAFVIAAPPCRESLRRNGLQIPVVRHRKITHQQHCGMAMSSLVWSI